MRGKDTQKIKTIFSASILHALKQQPKAKIEGAKGALVYFSTTQIKPDEMQNWIEEGKRVLQLFSI